jgi:hypothetical protein
MIGQGKRGEGANSGSRQEHLVGCDKVCVCVCVVVETEARFTEKETRVKIPAH